MATIDGKPHVPQFTDYQYYLPGGYQCPGCGGLMATKMALQVIFDEAPNAIVFGGSCGSGRSKVRPTALGVRASGAVAISAALAIRGIDRPVIVIGGEGQTFDMGLDDLSGALMSGHPFMMLVMDNQSYASSGGHRTSTTELFARTKLHLKGVRTPKKHPAVMMAYSGARFVATASLFYFRDYIRKLKLALTHMPSLIQIYTPCIPSHESDPKDSADMSRLAVQTGLFPLFEYLDGKFSRTTIPRRHVREYLDVVGNLHNLSEEQVEHLEQHAREVNAMVDDLVATSVAPPEG
jgi:pyruvate ferredoxin oxidoreductase beta subunit/2-oxoisovalerate ferredoxin oxidoreductase beta subunit